jgi:hypothetical protein
LFEAEENGHRFVYEFAGKSVAEQVLDVDKEHSIEKIACLPLQDEKRLANSIMWLQWDSAATPGSNGSTRKPLKTGDVVTGSHGWNCGTKKDASFLRQVVSVRSHATMEHPTTEITARDVSPLQVFNDLDIDFTWLRPSTNQDSRMLTDVDTTEDGVDVDTTEDGVSLNTREGGMSLDLNFNYDRETKRARMPIDMGVLLCDNCYAHFKPAMKFGLITEKFYPKEVYLQFDLEAGVNIDVRVHPRVIPVVNATVSAWESLLTDSGPDFLKDLLAVTVPLFVGLADFLDLTMVPLTEMFSRFGDDLVSLYQDARLHAAWSMNRNENFLRIGWSVERGLYTDMGFSLRTSFGLSGIPHMKEIFVGLKLCAGVEIRVGTEVLTALRLCPEVLLGKTEVIDQHGVIPDLTKTEVVPDKKLCITFESFETDLDLDKAFWTGIFHHDEPMAQMCFQGKCVATGIQYFEENTVTWNEEKCMDVRYSHLFGEGGGSLAFVVKEMDPVGYQQQYTQQQLWQLPESCKEECKKTFDAMPIPPSLQHEGSVAKLVVNLKFKELGRRVTSISERRESLACGASESAVATTLALDGTWSGFTYPNVYDEGKGKGEEVLAPAKAPVMRPKDAERTCVTIKNPPPLENNETDGPFVGAASGLGCKSYLMFVIFAALVAIGV